MKRFRMFEAVADVAEGNISIEEITVALNHAVRIQRQRQLIQEVIAATKKTYYLRSATWPPSTHRP